MSNVIEKDGNFISLVQDDVGKYVRIVEPGNVMIRVENFNPAIGDVIEVEQSNFEHAPATIAPEIQKYIKGIYKTHDGFLSLLDLDAISKELSPANDSSTVITN